MDYDIFGSYVQFICAVILSYCVSVVTGGSTCTFDDNGQPSHVYCDYGCCDTSCCSQEISTSVLIVACVVSGLVLVALAGAVIICCYKNYKDKQQSRVRTIRQEQDNNAPRRPVEPPKPPAYLESPPEYSEAMPDQHFRPPTVHGQYAQPYNQRFAGVHTSQGYPTTRSQTSQLRTSRQSTDGQTINTSSNGTSGVFISATSGAYPTRNSSNTQLPGTVGNEAPPPYTEFIRGQTPADRRNRFIRNTALDQPVNTSNTVIQEESSETWSQTTTRQSNTRGNSTGMSRAGSRLPTRQVSREASRQLEVPSSNTGNSSAATRSRMLTRASSNTRTGRNTNMIDDEDVEELAII